MSVKSVLGSKKASLLIIEERKFKDIVIGVPHHAPGGVEKLPCAEHQESDENAGYLGRYIAKKLRSCSIIACNYPIDSNKCIRTDYSMQITYWNPKFLVEIHGHGGGKANYDIEISSGKQENSKWSEKLELKLRSKCSNLKEFKSMTICGKLEKIYFKATKSATIMDGRWIPFHIELPSILRKSSETNIFKPPGIGYDFCDILIQALAEICRMK